MCAHLFLERGQYVSGLKGHPYDLDSCMSVHLLENCPLLDSLKPMEQAFPSITLTPVSENWKGETNVATVSLCNSSLEENVFKAHCCSGPVCEWKLENKCHEH